MIGLLETLLSFVVAVADEKIVARVERFHERRHQLGIYVGRIFMDASITRSIEARYYTDPGIFRAETEGVLARTWQFAGHASQLEDAGDYFSFELAGESLFCIRGHDGEIRTFYNVCQHRAHQLVSGAGSTRTLVCPYHAWDLRTHRRIAFPDPISRTWRDSIDPKSA